MHKIIFFICLSMPVFGQKAISFVVSPGQAIGQCGGYFITGTIGQPGAGTFSCGEGTIIVGFPQPVDYEVVPVRHFEFFRDVNLYPNPASDILFLDGELSGDFHHIQMVIYNLLGQRQESYARWLPDSRMEIPVEDLKPGVYTLRLFDAALGQQSFLFVKN